MTSPTIPVPAASPADTDQPALQAQHLHKTYPLRRAGRRNLQVRAVEDVSLDLRRGHITAIVGESGSGKSTIAKLLSGLEKPSSGRLLLDGVDTRGRAATGKVQMVFQDPFASLNPVHTVEHHLTRALVLHGPRRTRAELHQDALDLLERVSLTPAEEFAKRKPHELSGGQRQRVSIARALAVRPEVLLADEPVSMLDVSIRLGILNLLRDLARDENLALLYITHDIASARYFADTVLVMYGGRLVESGRPEELTQRPAHPYTQLLIESAPNPARRDARAVPAAQGSASGAGLPQAGCRFQPRCPHALSVCASEQPPDLAVADGHWAACWLHAPEDTTSAAATP